MNPTRESIRRFEKRLTKIRVLKRLEESFEKEVNEDVRLELKMIINKIRTALE